MRELYIIGAGGFGREVAWLVERINEHELTWDLKGFIDDNELIRDTTQDGYHVLGDCDWLGKLNHDVFVVCAVGAAKTRKMIINKLQKYSNIKFATVVDPSVLMSKTVTLGDDVIICAGTILTVDITVGNHTIINLDCTIGHDVMLGEYNTLYPSVNVSGNVVTGSGVELGTGMQIIQGKKIGDNTIIGAGAVAINDIQSNSTAVGAPAKVIKKNDIMAF